MYNEDKSELQEYKKKYFRVQPIAADGDCLYNAVLESLKMKNISKIPESSKSLRQTLLKHAETFPFSKELYKKETMKRIEKGIICKGDIESWGENEEIDLLADLFNVCICIWVVAQKMWLYSFPKSSGNSSLKDKFGLSTCDKLIFLRLVGGKSSTKMGTHFEALLPVLNDSNSNSNS